MADEKEVKISKAAEALAKEKEVDLSKIAGTGKDGQITKGDVEASLKPPPEENPPGNNQPPPPPPPKKGKTYQLDPLVTRQGYFGKINGSVISIKAGATEIDSPEDEEVFRQLVFAGVILVPKDDSRLSKVASR